MRRTLALTVLAVLVAALAGPVLTAPASDAQAATGVAFVVQAMPGASYDVAIDGDQVEGDVPEGDVLGPFDLVAGDHDVTFTDIAGGAVLTSTFTIDPAGSRTSCCTGRPPRQGTPLVNTYAAPMDAIGPGKARVLLAHTATVPPADVRVDGKVVFVNIANGEYANADLPAGGHRSSCYPTGQSSGAILGPVSVDLPARTITLVYAVGTPRDGSMRVISTRSASPPTGLSRPGGSRRVRPGWSATCTSTRSPAAERLDEESGSSWLQAFSCWRRSGSG